METFVWCEDTGSGYDFWKAVFGTLYHGFTIESKRNNSELCKEVSKIDPNDANRYYVLMDNAIDNSDVRREAERLYRASKDKPNVKVIKIHSFESALLSFEKFEYLIFAPEDELREKRRGLLESRKSFVDMIRFGGTSENLSAIKDWLEYSPRLNSEQFAAKLLFDITRNTGFETSKGHLGECFINSCCDWEKRKPDDICGLDDSPLSSEDKIKDIVEHSVINEALEKAGLK